MKQTFLKPNVHEQKIDILFRYIPYEHAYENVQNGVIHFSSPYSFNDIYDSLGVFQVDDFYDTMLSGKIGNDVINIIKHNGEIDKMNFDISRITIYQFCCYIKSKDIFLCYNDISSYFRKYVGKVVLNQNLKVACFSEKNDSLLMWAHYAGNFTGICVEYDLCKDEILKENCTRVKYSTKKINNTKLETSFAKSSDWSYEKEWRLVCEKGNEDYIKTNSISAIYLGANMLQDNSFKLIALAKSKK